MPENPTEKRSDKAVPLVIYKGGERVVIGSAYLKGDGRIEAQVAKDVREDLKHLLFGDRVGDISINPLYTSTMVNARTNETKEVAVVPPLMIRRTSGESK